MIAYLPHTEEDIKIMLDAIGITDIEQLFADIPRELTLEKPFEIPEGIPEFEVYRRMQVLSAGIRLDAV
jgi:glycine dehydrogenase subunit 1